MENYKAPMDNDQNLHYNIWARLILQLSYY